MATKNYLSLAGLTTYDGLIKEYIGTEDAKSIKSITVSGNTVSFFKTADASGTAAYTVNLPDVSGFMDKIANATGNMVVASTANGSVAESEISVDDLVTGYFTDEAADGQIILYDGVNNDIKASSTDISDLATNAFVGTIPAGAQATTIAGYIDEAVDGLADEVISKIANADGNKVVKSNSNGTISETGISVSDVVVQDDIAGMVTGYFPSGEYEDGDLVIARSPGSDTMVMSSSLNVSDIATTTFVGDIPQGSTATTIVGYVDEVGDAVSDEIETLEQSLATVAQSGNAEDVSYDNTDSGLIADDVQSAIDELAEASSGGVASKTVYIVDNGATSDYARVYSIYQGAEGSVSDPVAAEKLIDINVPKDQVVEDGSVVDITFSNNKLWDGNVDVTTLIVGSGTPTAADAGKYIKLELQNVTDPLYIAAQSLVDIYTAQQSAAQVQLAISSANEISATIVAGSIGTTELAGSAVTTAKIADDAVTATKIDISAHTEAQTAGADGLAISVTTTDGQVSGVSGSIAANTYDAYGSASAAETAANGYTDSAIAALDATKSQTAGADGLALSITEVDGKITSISGSIAANTYDASGAAATAKSEVIGASGDAASASTIYGAKAYADAATDAIATADIQALFE